MPINRDSFSSLCGRWEFVRAIVVLVIAFATSVALADEVRRDDAEWTEWVRDCGVGSASLACLESPRLAVHDDGRLVSIEYCWPQEEGCPPPNDSIVPIEVSGRYLRSDDSITIEIDDRSVTTQPKGWLWGHRRVSCETTETADTLTLSKCTGEGSYYADDTPPEEMTFKLWYEWVIPDAVPQKPDGR